MKKIAALIAASVLLLALLAGCGGGNNSGGGGGSPAAADNATLNFVGTTVTAYVTAIDGKNVTVSLISFPSGMRTSGNGQTSNGTTGGGATSGGTPDNSQSGAPTQINPGDGQVTQGNTQGGQPYSGRGQNGQGNGQFMISGGLSATLTINNESILIKDGSQGALSDIQTGNTLVIAFGSDGQIQSVTIQAAVSTNIPGSGDPNTTAPDGQQAPETSA